MRFIFFLCLFILINCKSAAPAKVEQLSLTKVVESEIGVGAIIEKNKSETFALAHLEKDRKVNYLVIRLKDLQVIINETVQGSVSWDRDMTIKIALTPEMVKRNSSPKDRFRIIDLNNYIENKK